MNTSQFIVKSKYADSSTRIATHTIMYTYYVQHTYVHGGKTSRGDIDEESSSLLGSVHAASGQSVL